MTKHNDRPRLVLVIGMNSTKIGGMEKFLRALCIGMNSAGWDSVLCLDGPPSAHVEDYFRLPFITLESVQNQQNLGIDAAPALWKVFRKHRPTVCMYAFHSVMRVFPWLAKAAGAQRIYFNDHSSRAQGVQPSLLPVHKRIVARSLTAPLTGIMSVSDFTRRSGTAYGMTSAPNIVVRNGIEILDSDRDLGLAFRRSHGIPQDATVVVQICWMMPIKGVEIMLEAARGLLSRHPELYLLFVGSGDMLETYRRKAMQMKDGNRILFTGIVNEPVKAGVLDASDIYGQPSLWQEAAPLAVLEAMSKYLPVVASDTGGLPEMVVNGTTGSLVPPGDSEVLERELEKLVVDEQARRRLGEAGRRKVEAEHRLEDMVARYVNILSGRTPLIEERQQV